MYTWELSRHVFPSTLCVADASRGQKRVWDPLELKLQMTMIELAESGT